MLYKYSQAHFHTVQVLSSPLPYCRSTLKPTPILQEYSQAHFHTAEVLSSPLPYCRSTLKPTPILQEYSQAHFHTAEVFSSPLPYCRSTLKPTSILQKYFEQIHLSLHTQPSASLLLTHPAILTNSANSHCNNPDHASLHQIHQPLHQGLYIHTHRRIKSQ